MRSSRVSGTYVSYVPTWLTILTVCRNRDATTWSTWCQRTSRRLPRPIRSGVTTSVERCQQLHEARHESLGLVSALRRTTATGHFSVITSLSTCGQHLLDPVPRPRRPDVSTHLIWCHHSLERVEKTVTPHLVDPTTLAGTISGSRNVRCRGSKYRPLWFQIPVAPVRAPGRRGFDSRSLWFSDPLAPRQIPVIVVGSTCRRGSSRMCRTTRSRSPRFGIPVVAVRGPCHRGLARR